MMLFLFEQLMFIFTLLLVGFVPGWLLLSLLFHRGDPLSFIEKVFLALPISFASVTFLTLILGKLAIALTQRSVLLSVLAMSALFWILHTLMRNPVKNSITKNTDALFDFSHKKIYLIGLLLLMTLLIKGSYLVNTIFPTSTDLGHHLFWVEKTIKTGQLPIYEERQIITTQTDEHILSAPQPIADFIIGEHLFFAVVGLISEQKTISAAPSLTLLLFNIGTIGILFILGLRLGHGLIRSFLGDTRRGIELAQRASIAILLFAGPLYAIAGPQAKFVSGGVIGNILGNLLIPTVLYFLYRAYIRKDAQMLFFALLTTITLIYTHHLSTFVLLFIFIFTGALSIANNIKNIGAYFAQWLRLLCTPHVVVLLILSALLVVFAHTPSYLNPSDVSSTLGEPSKDTRTGLTPTQLLYTIGEARFVFALIGFLLLLPLFRKALRAPERHVIFFALSILAGWYTSTTLMTLAPHLLNINIISSRIANYTIGPAILLAGIGLTLTFSFLYNKYRNRSTVPFALFVVSFFVLMTFVFTSGLYDNKQAFRDAPNTVAATQTFHSAAYLGHTLREEDLFLKDHNFVTADAFIKLSFLRDYRFPLSRGFFKRYESNTREQCTLLMIAQPRSTAGQKCFDDLGVNVVLVDTQEDAGQFHRAEDFTRIYQNDAVSIFMKKN